MASVYTEGQLPHSSESPRQRRRRRGDAELAFPAPLRDAPTQPSLSAWLLALPHGERQQTLSVDNSWATFLIRQMIGRKLRDGDVEFMPLVKSACSESSKLEDYYIVCRPEHESPASDTEFEQTLRLCDTVQYLDTLTVAGDLVNDCSRFLRLAETVSGGGAFRSPCQAFWHTSFKCWTWECPAWTAGKTLTLSQFALALLEKACWQRFYSACNLDPRAPGETLSYTFDPQPACTSDAYSLAGYWKSLDKDRRTQLAGDLPRLNSEFSQQKLRHQELQRKNPDMLQTQSASFLTVVPNSSAHYSALRAKAQQYMAQGCVEQMKRTQGEFTPAEFVEYLSKSPLERAGTVYDLVARSVLAAVREGMKAQIANDLLQSEKRAEPLPSKRKRKNHKKKPRRDPSSASTACSPATPVSASPQREDHEAQDLATFILELVLSQVTSNISAETDFQTVMAGRKKAKKTNLFVGTSRMRKFKPKIKNVQQSLGAMKSAPVSPAIIKWAKEECTTPPVTLQSPIDFPPLSASPTFNYDSLTTEISNFHSQIQEEMSRRVRVMGYLVNKLQEVLLCLFPGSYLAIFGSYATGLALPSSDLDVALVNAGMCVDDIVQAVAMLEEVLPAYRWVESIKGIATATVPVVKLVVNMEFFCREIHDLVQVDITFEDSTSELVSNHLGIATCAWVQDFLQRFPQAASCFLVLKHLLLRYQLNSTYHGGLSSYSLLLWLSAYLKMHEHENAGEVMVGFFRTYGMEICFKGTGVAAGEGNCYFPRTQPVFTLCETVDPLRHDNNTTKGAFRIAEVQELFKRAYEFLAASSARSVPHVLSRLLAKSDLIKV